MREITQERLAKLTYVPLKPDATKEEVFVPGNVLRLKNKVRQSIAGRYCPIYEDVEPLNKYELVGHVNDLAGICDDCQRYIDDIDGIAHISELFEEAWHKGYGEGLDDGLNK